MKDYDGIFCDKNQNCTQNCTYIFLMCFSISPPCSLSIFIHTYLVSNSHCFAYIKFRYSEKATKILPTFYLTLLSSGSIGRWAKFLWPSQNIRTLIRFSSTTIDVTSGVSGNPRDLAEYNRRTNIQPKLKKLF